MNNMNDPNLLVELPDEGVERRPSYNISYECHDSFIFDELSKLADEDSDDDDSSIESQDQHENAENPALDDAADETPPQRRTSLLLSLGNSLRSVVEGRSVEESPEDEPNNDTDGPPPVRRPSLIAQFQNRVIRKEEGAGNITRAVSVSVGAFGHRRLSFSSRRNSWGSAGRPGTSASFDSESMAQITQAVASLRNETFQQNQHTPDHRRNSAASSAGRALLNR